MIRNLYGKGLRRTTPLWTQKHHRNEQSAVTTATLVHWTARCRRIFLVTFGLYWEHHDWPAVYHHDEPSKVAQLANNQRNLFHPLVLLETTEFVRRVTGTDRRGALRVVTLGRMVSSLCMAPAIGVLALAAYRQHSWIATGTVGIFMITYFRFYEVAHYFKEDTPHLLAMSLVLLAGFCHAGEPSRRTLVSLGAAVGLAMSFKYVGAAFFAIALPLTLLYPSGKLDRRLLWLGSCALMITTLVYLRLLLIDDPFGTLRKSLYQEVTWMVTGHKGIGTAVPNWDCLERLHFDLSLHGLLFLALGIPFFQTPIPS
jgi:hypothetical protein